jgi:hypothetical protein
MSTYDPLARRGPSGFHSMQMANIGAWRLKFALRGDDIFLRGRPSYKTFLRG